MLSLLFLGLLTRSATGRGERPRRALARTCRVKLLPARLLCRKAAPEFRLGLVKETNPMETPDPIDGEQRRSKPTGLWKVLFHRRTLKVILALVPLLTKLVQLVIMIVRASKGE